jgi:DNA-binding CsgD family transcriptional regulator
VGHATRDPHLTPQEEQLLGLLRQGTHAVADLAQALRTSPAHVASILGSLDRKVGLVRCVRSGALCYGLAE